MEHKNHELQYSLKYLFIAKFMDGSMLEQSLDDISKIDPKRSQFYDVINSGKELQTFSLIGEGNKLTVNLITGIFTVNGLPVLLESDKLPMFPDKFNLIFYRQHKHDFNATYDTKTGEQIDRKQTNHFIEYFIGWQCIIKGRSYQQKLAVS